MRKGTARKRSEHGFAFGKGTVVEYCKIKDAHMHKNFLRMNVHKGTVMKIAAVKFLTAKVYILKD